MVTFFPVKSHVQHHQVCSRGAFPLVWLGHDQHETRKYCEPGSEVLPRDAQGFAGEYLPGNRVMTDFLGAFIVDC